MTQPNTKSPPFWTITLSIINIAIVAYVLVEHHQTKYALLNTLSQAQSLSQTQEKRHQQEIAQLKKTFQTTIRQAQIPAELHLDVWQQCHMAMRMSYYHLVFLQQSQQAIQWLQTAQDTLAQNPDSTTKQISQKIQKLIQTLTKTTQPSQDYLLDQISNIQKHILKLEPSFIPQKAKQLAQVQSSTTWQDWLSLQSWHQYTKQQVTNAYEAFWDGIHIQQHDDMPLSVLDQPTLARFKFSSQMLLEQTQWAVIYQNQTIYEHSLSSLQTLITTRFPNHPNAKPILSLLKNMQSNPVQNSSNDYLTLLKEIEQHVTHQNHKRHNQQAHPVAKKNPKQASPNLQASATIQQNLS